MVRSPYSPSSMYLRGTIQDLGFRAYQMQKGLGFREILRERERGSDLGLKVWGGSGVLRFRLFGLCAGSLNPEP